MEKGSIWNEFPFGKTSRKQEPPWPLSEGTGVFLEANALEVNSGRGKFVTPPRVLNTRAKEQGLLGPSAPRVTRATWEEATPEGLKGKS